MKELKQFKRDLKRIVNYFNEAYYWIFTDARIEKFNGDCQEIKKDLEALQKEIERILERLN
jgi:ubiquinone biosynthesis protein UbiJ